MELNEINQSYKEDGKKLARVNTDKVKNKIAELEQTVIHLADEYQDLSTKKARAERDKDTATAKAAEKDMKAKAEEVKKARSSLAKLKEQLSKAQKAVDDHVKLVEEMAKSNPELKAQLAAAIKTKFERAVARNNSEKEKIAKQVEPLKIIKNAAQKDPQVSHILLGMEEDYKNMEMLQAIISKGNKSPDEIKDAQEKIAEFSKQREAKKSKLAAYFKGTISKADIDRITYLDVLDKEIKASDRKIAGLNKQNANYETALKNMGEVTQSKDSSQKTSIFNRIKPEQGAQPVQLGQDKDSSSSGLPATKPKWWQFIKRFKNWYHKNDSIKAANSEKGESHDSDPTQVLDKKSFKDSMKYDVVRDYKDKLEQEYLKAAKAQNKAEKAAQKDEDEKDEPEL